MGIKGLNQFLSKTMNIRPQPIEIEHLKGERVAIDTNYLVGRFYSSAKNKLLKKAKLLIEFPNDEDVVPIAMDSIRGFLSDFTNNGIDIVLCYDGSMSKLKAQTLKKRKKNQEDKKEILEEVMNKMENGTMEERKKLIESYKKAYVGYYNFKIVLMIVEACKREFSQYDNLVASDINPEGEALCAYLVNTNDCFAAYSADSDLLAYGTRFIINDVGWKRINGNSKLCLTMHSYKRVLTALGFTDSEFMDFCIMCGTDFNDNIPNKGAVRSYGIIKKYKDIDYIENLDVSILNHKEVRKIFKHSREPSDEVIFTMLPKENVEYFSAI